jgi:hypothetical protein
MGGWLKANFGADISIITETARKIMMRVGNPSIHYQ